MSTIHNREGVTLIWTVEYLGSWGVVDKLTIFGALIDDLNRQSFWRRVLEISLARKQKPNEELDFLAKFFGQIVYKCL